MSIEKLEKHEVLGLLRPDEIKRLSMDSGEMALKAGEKIYSEGVPASHIFVLIKGRVELKIQTQASSVLLIDDLIEGNIFGVSSLLGADRYLLNAECVEDSEILKIEGKILRQILDENPVVGYAIQRRLSRIFFKRYLKTMETLQTIHTDTSDRRIRSA
jgi:CRP-like cAMP-binding protein